MNSKDNIYNDLDVNDGFPEGSSLKDLTLGARVKLRWPDAPDGWGVVLEIHLMHHLYKGHRSFRVLPPDRATYFLAVHTQIIEFGPPIEVIPPIEKPTPPPSRVRKEHQER